MENVLWCRSYQTGRSSHSEMSLRKGVLKICSRFTGEDLCQSMISVKSASALGITGVTKGKFKETLYWDLGLESGIWKVSLIL